MTPDTLTDIPQKDELQTIASTLTDYFSTHAKIAKNLRDKSTDTDAKKVGADALVSLKKCSERILPIINDILSDPTNTSNWQNLSKLTDVAKKSSQKMKPFSSESNTFTRNDKAINNELQKMAKLSQEVKDKYVSSEQSPEILVADVIRGIQKHLKIGRDGGNAASTSKQKVGGGVGGVV